MNRVLLTGATGPIGRQLLQQLVERGDEVHATHRGQAVDGLEDRAQWHRVDLLDRDSIDGLISWVRPRRLAHLAWSRNRGALVNSAEHLEWADASVRLLEAFVAGGGKRALIAGSAAEYSWGQGRCTEGDTPLEPSTTYGRAKRRVYESAVELSGTTSISVTWPRVFWTFGPGEEPNRLISALVRPLLRGEPAQVFGIDNRRDYLYAEDVGAALATLLHSNLTGPVNVASGEARSVSELVELVTGQIGRPELVRTRPVPAARREAPLVVADIRRLRDELGWTPQVALEEGIARTIAWWRRL